MRDQLEARFYESTVAYKWAQSINTYEMDSYLSTRIRTVPLLRIISGFKDRHSGQHGEMLVSAAPDALSAACDGEGPARDNAIRRNMPWGPYH